MKTKLVFCFLLLLGGNALAQIPDIFSTDATEAASYLTGPNVQVSNAVFSGVPSQLARFDDGADKIGFAQGIALTSGNAQFAGTFGNSNPGDQMPVNSEASDLDLDAINGTGYPRDAAVLEFDIVTTGNSLDVQYVFGSEEYLQYVGSNFNDAFGFFISGPGIEGPYQDDAVNIAVVNSSPVSVNTVNPLTNSQYYIDNLFFNQGPLNEGNAQFQYDGHTVVMTASHPVRCNTTYHLKIAICNTNDHIYDSGVFLKRGTLASNFTPPGPLVISPVPVCEGEDLTLTVEGDPTWEYTWSTGQSGIGLLEITTTASLLISEYSVTAEYLDGCMLEMIPTQSTAVVHPLNNIPPTCPGGNLYVQADDWLILTVPSFDTDPERTFIERTGGNAGGTFTPIANPLAQFQSGNYAWHPSESDIGFHTLELTVTDNNVCGNLENTCHYNIKVLCRYCPTCVYYENRSPDGLPLPLITVAGACIVAGTDVDNSQTNGPVDTGTESVTFRAPVITLAPGFIAGQGFVAEVDMNTCTENCEECCDGGAGVIIDLPLPNVITPNGDGVNDRWVVRDQQHPYCAYNANFFDLWVFSRWDTPQQELVVHHQGQGYCCPFISSAPGVNVIPSINWDGKWANGNYVPDGVYFYILEVESNCGSTAAHTGYIQVLDAGGMSGGEESMVLDQNGAIEVLDATKCVRVLPMGAALVGADKGVVLRAPIGIEIYPNPTNGDLVINSNEVIASVAVYDGVGRLLLAEQPQSQQFVLDLGSLAAGSYTLTVGHTSGNLHSERIVKN